MATDWLSATAMLFCGLVHQRIHDLRGMRGRGLLADVGALRGNGAFGELEVGDPFLANQVQIDGDRLGFQLLYPPPPFADSLTAPSRSPFSRRLDGS